MGYILPITQHTYKNYQHRMTENKKSPYHIGASYKVVFHKINEEYDDSDKNIMKNKLQDEKVKSRREVPAYQMNTSEKAKLTGKGGQFNEQVETNKKVLI